MSNNIDLGPQNEAKVRFNDVGHSDNKLMFQYGNTLVDGCPDECLCSDVLNLDSADRGVDCRQLQADNVENMSRMSHNLKHRKIVKSEHRHGKFEFNANKFNARVHSVNDLTEMYPKCFKGIGNLPGEYHVELRAGA